MSSNQNSTHEEIVRLWEEKNTKGLSPDQIILIFGGALQAIERRCLNTLSTVTVHVVLDRVLHEGLEEFPFLSEITIEVHGLNYSTLCQKKDGYTLDDIRKALRYLLIKILTVIGNITSEVLTTALHKELMEVTSDNALKVLDVQNLIPINTPKKRGEK